MRAFPKTNQTTARLFRTVAIFAIFVVWSCFPVSQRSGGEETSDAGQKHWVQKGDTVWEIAQKYGVKPDEVIQLNDLKKPYVIFPGQVLRIRGAAVTLPGGEEPSPPTKEAESSPSDDNRLKHVVRMGESVSEIARKYNVNPDEVIALNGLKEPYLIFPGQVLVIPGFVSPPSRAQDIASVCALRRGIRSRDWRYIVIHHSDTTTGNAAIFDRNHRRRGMENGLAYHFVIGNGKGSSDGEIEVGGRWLNQLAGGYCRNQRMNEIGIGICLVGNFDRYRPTRKQTESLVRLVKYLMVKYEIPKRRIIGHRDVRGSPTDCPGRYLSLVELRNRL
jgi:LysM repeat protein